MRLANSSAAAFGLTCLLLLEGISCPFGGQEHWEAGERQDEVEIESEIRQEDQRRCNRHPKHHLVCRIQISVLVQVSIVVFGEQIRLHDGVDPVYEDEHTERVVVHFSALPAKKAHEDGHDETVAKGQ